ncbi:MAG: TonB-dependent receptor [Bacteroidota bacterium]
MFRFLTILFFLCGIAFRGWAQAPDSLQSKELDEVVVTATRSERTMGALPMPVMLVQKSQIKAMGSLRLNDVLTEQTGLAVVPQVNGAGNGIQLQGLNPDYTLILLDGEPLIGRFTGSLDLSRIAVGNIKQIEIVKGPSSSLYGSDALAGVVNIITDRPQGIRGSFYSRYGTNNTLDLSGDYSYQSAKFGVYVYGNRYSTGGYDLTPGDNAPTVSPFSNYTFNAKFTYRFSPKTDLTVSGRYFTQEQDFDNQVDISSSESIRTYGPGTTRDWNINPVLVHRFNSRLKTTARFYATGYKTETHLNESVTDTLYYTDDFKQTFMRPELNAEYYFNEANILTVGLGETFESVQTSRYGDEAIRKQQTRYFFFQDEITLFKKLSVIAGGRYDQNSVYGSQFSPKLSARYELNSKVSLKASFGMGFKSPDFRQLYFNFTNTAAGGYSVLGTEVVGERLAQMAAEGRIQSYVFDPAKIGNLQAESSKAVNVGARVVLAKQLVGEVNGFYNSIDNLIETQIVAVTTANQNIYSYRNIQRAYTAGLESNFSYPLNKNLSVSLGYQLLYAKDKDIEEQVKEGKVYWRDPETFVTRVLKPGEYFGLYNRSRHMGNAKLFYSNKEKGLDASLRVIYRGRFGVGDIRGTTGGGEIPSSDYNNNGILDTHDKFVDGYATINVSVAKTIRQGIRFQAGVDNVFDQKSPLFVPNLPGRIMYASINYTFSRKSN